MRIIGPYRYGDTEEVVLCDDATGWYYRSDREPVGTFTMERIWEEMRKARQLFELHAKPEPPDRLA